MRSIAAVLLIAGMLGIAAPAGASSHATTPVTTLRITVTKKGVVGGIKKFTVRKNAHVVLLVTSTIGKAVHLHGYDIEKDIVSKTKPVRIAFVAKVSGVFEIELHITEARGLRLGLLTVK